jgi:hypothetical protein
MGNSGMRQTFEMVVEIDETYAGGKPGKENKKKTPMVGVKEWSSKQVYARVTLADKEGKKLLGETVTFGFG